MASAHEASEIPYAYQMFDQAPEQSTPLAAPLSTQPISSCWRNFVRPGRLGGPDPTAWPALTRKDPQAQRLGHRVSTRDILPPDRLQLVGTLLADENPLR